MFIPVIDGYSTFPSGSHEHRTSTSSVEWLHDALERHTIAERDPLRLYEYLRTASGDPAVAVVMQLMKDEGRHAGLLKRIEATLRGAIDQTASAQAVPTPEAPSQPVRQALLDTASALIRADLTASRYLHGLAHRAKAVNSDLERVLIEAMALERDRHALLLRFVRDRLANRPRTVDGPGD